MNCITWPQEHGHSFFVKEKPLQHNDITNSYVNYHVVVIKLYSMFDMEISCHEKSHHETTADRTKMTSFAKAVNFSHGSHKRLLL